MKIKLAALTNALFFSVALSVPVSMTVSVAVSAEEVRIPIGQQQVGPRTGETKEQVQDTFGEPSSITGPIGTPPIYYWEYDSFTVYFESNHVIRTVSKYLPKP